MNSNCRANVKAIVFLQAGVHLEKMSRGSESCQLKNCRGEGIISLVPTPSHSVHKFQEGVRFWQMGVNASPPPFLPPKWSPDYKVKQRSQQLLQVKLRTSGLTCQCSTAKLWQLIDHQPSQSSICNTQFSCTPKCYSVCTATTMLRIVRIEKVGGCLVTITQ